MPCFIDMSGMRFGRLRVIGRAPDRGDKRVRWVCQCDCGQESEPLGQSLRAGTTVSCGCAQRDWARKFGRESNKTHGHSMTPTYRIWSGLKHRCADSSNPNYGGRGIRVCDRWMDFRKFLADMGPRPSKQHSIDRINNDGDYEPENCRWATPRQQANNSRKAVFYQYEGEKLSVAQLARRCGVPYKTFHARLARGWPLDRAMNTPLPQKGNS